MRVANSLGAALTLVAATSSSAQQTPQIFRTTTELVQTDVIVVDRQGRFVDGLQREDFELQVDGRPQSIAFFERVQAGSASEALQVAAARGEPAAQPLAGSLERPTDRGRTVLFFVDDLHLAQDGLRRANVLLTAFIEKQMGQRDQVAIASASGQLGFLQQLTDSKTMLRAAVARLSNRAPVVMDTDRPHMSPHQAHVLELGTDRQLFEFFVKETLRENPFITRQAAESIVASRARQMVAQEAAATRRTLVALEALIRSKSDLAGRKVLFFLSDGFEMDVRDPDANNLLRRAADAAARSATVIYTMDAKGLATQPSFQANRPTVFDPDQALVRTDADELWANQGPLYTLAAESGGRALLNSNALAAFVPRVLQETSRYYLLAWTPETNLQNKSFHRVEVSVKGRPELTLRAQRVFFDAPVPVAPMAAAPSRGRRIDVPAAASPEASADAALLSALHSPYRVRALPTELSVGFMDIPGTGTVLTASTRVDVTQTAVDVVYAVFNEKGEGLLSLKERLQKGSAASSTHQFRLGPGLYQVRVATRDAETGTLGSAMEWMEIPKLVGGAFAMSSLIVERNAQRLRFHVYVYNAVHAASPPDVTLKVQVFRGEKLVIAAPVSRLKTGETADLSRIPYSAELSLEGLPSGEYVLQVIAADRTAAATASRRLEFAIN